MDYTDSVVIQALARQLQRVLIVDPNNNACKILSDLMKNLGSLKVLTTHRTSFAFEIARDSNPQIIFTEYAAENFDGVDFVRRLRRSDMRCRQVPIVMTTSEATAESIRATRDAGAHEFLRKPFTLNELYRRLEAVTMHSRDWIEAPSYVGPDRRRFNSAAFSGDLKRQYDEAPMSTHARTVNILMKMKDAIDAIERDPVGSARVLIEQADDLNVIAFEAQDFNVGQAAHELKVFVVASLKAGGLTRENMRKHAAGLMSAMSLMGLPPR